MNDYSRVSKRFTVLTNMQPAGWFKVDRARSPKFVIAISVINVN